MRYDDAELRDILAAEYVLGTLKKGARSRFEQLCLSRPDYQAATYRWHSRINLLADTVPAVMPKRHVWLNIEARLFHAGKSTALKWWRNIALVTSVLSVALSIFVATELLKTPTTITTPIPTMVAMLANESAEQAWIVSYSRNADGKAEIRASTLDALERDDEKSFELWLLPPHQSAPISLGLLPQDGSASLIIDEQTAATLVDGALAVSLEPSGGSPTGLPTGPVLYQGKLARI